MTKERSLKKAKRSREILTLLAACLIAGIILYPFFWVLSTALKSDSELFVFPPKLIPAQIIWGNFADAWKLIDFPQSFLNSFMVSVPTAVLTVVLCSMAAYALTRMNFKYATAVFFVYLSTMMVPQVVRLIPSFILVKNMGLMNRYTGLIFPLVAWAIPFGTFLIRQFFLGIPKELNEAAYVDGAGHFRIFLQVIVPNAVPGMLTLGTYVFLQSWNNLMWPLVALNKSEMFPITLAMASLTGPSVEFIPPWNEVMAATLISILPILLLYLFLQKYFIQSVALSGVKG